MRRPDDKDPDPKGGRAAERLKEFLRERAPAGLPSEEEKEKEEGSTEQNPESPSNPTPDCNEP